MTNEVNLPTKGNILVVDDLTDNLDLLCMILTEGGFTVRPTTSGKFALQAAKAAPPDLILLDIIMPEMDGLEVCRLLKEDPNLRGIPVIFISALGEIHDKIRFQEGDAFPCRGFIPGNYVLLTVSDTGHGMDEATLGKIFDPYFTTKAASEGTGLGLAVVKGIVKGHHGYIVANSTLEAGSTFEVFLPVLNPKQLEEDLSGVAEEKPSLYVGRERIMVVDDDETVISIYENLLGSYGYSVFAFSQSVDAFSYFCQAPSEIDLVITDLTMPTLDGIGLVSRMLSVRPELPVIICSGYDETIYKEQARMAGIEKYLQKPFTQEELLRGIRKVLDKCAERETSMRIEGE